MKKSKAGGTVNQHNFNPETYRFAMQEALAVAQASDDESTQTGAVLVSQDGTELISTGANNMPLGVRDTPDRHKRPLKYSVREHAERAAIYQAAKYGKQTIDSVMVSVWAGCADCSRAAIGAGASAFVSFPWRPADNPNHWDDDIRLGRQMLTEAGLAVIDYDFPGIAIPTIRRNYGVWVPESIDGNG
jgi:deoxycytidylate deaminase